MPHADDDRPNEQGGEAPPMQQPEAPQSGDPAAAADPSSPAAPGAEAPGDRPRRRPRRRRRRKGPRPEGAATAPSADAGPGGDPPGAAGVPAPTEAKPSEASPRANTPNRMPRPRGPGGRGPRERRPHVERPREGTPREGMPRGERPHEGTPREGTPREARAPGRGAPGKDRRERGPRGPKTQPHGKGPGAFERKPEPKLYSFEAVVDRGFEDVTDAANEGAVRRVTWTIVKRSVADQRRTKLVSAVYVLQRDGVDTEFANLGSARAAVNKTISHPEKLTRAKAEYAAAKKK